jgi:hypothetical protein
VADAPRDTGDLAAVPADEQLDVDDAADALEDAADALALEQAIAAAYADPGDVVEEDLL